MTFGFKSGEKITFMWNTTVFQSVTDIFSFKKLI